MCLSFCMSLCLYHVGFWLSKTIIGMSIAWRRSIWCASFQFRRSGLWLRMGLYNAVFSWADGRIICRHWLGWRIFISYLHCRHTGLCNSQVHCRRTSRGHRSTTSSECIWKTQREKPFRPRWLTNRLRLPLLLPPSPNPRAAGPRIPAPTCSSDNCVF